MGQYFKGNSKKQELGQQDGYAYKDTCHQVWRPECDLWNKRSWKGKTNSPKLSSDFYMCAMAGMCAHFPRTK